VRLPWLVAVAVAAAACGDSVPEIRNLKYSPNAALVGEDSTITGTVDYTDSGNDVSQTIFQLIDANGKVTTSPPEPIMNAGAGVIGTVNFSIKFTPTIAGNWGFNIWLVDLRSFRSNILQGIIRVSLNQPAM
jgi:hypothetical protein